ncbi:uncharacterized protein PV09_00513 [Verruconis gallopava]|uniref:Ribosome biogenesis protein SLX9 n=1 Tax=Verruconis gallopava TaxID=253628 RepID=A0A0D2APY3_9PEZI|nr:uncharacterized protein PV09_00513 [Verruconis gallopava]KIW08545.1 hypothetical protein PV09_00513 [Verruconis gallopava]
MAPVKPTSKEKRRGVDPLAIKQRTGYQARATDSVFTTTKKDKQLMKRSIFMSKVLDAGVKKHKRRRPGKKLVANLESLEDAIQDVADSSAQRPPQMRNVREGRGQAKRMEKVLKDERDRFGKNLAVLSASSQSAAQGASSTGSKFAALRAHIQANMSSAAPAAGGG